MASVSDIHDKIRLWPRIKALLKPYQSLEKFVIFVGQPRSGHSVVGALLNACPEALIAHNLDVLQLLKDGAGKDSVFQGIEEREKWFNGRGRFLGGYSYVIPDAPAVYNHSMRIIGAKKAGATSRHLLKQPSLIADLAKCVGLPVVGIHHIRNPWDNISSIYHAKILDVDRTLQEATEFYFHNIEGAVAGWSANESHARFIRTYHEEMISSPRSFQASLCEELGILREEAVLDACCRFVHPTPRLTRHSAPWTPDLILQVQERAKQYDFLRHYSFD